MEQKTKKEKEYRTIKDIMKDLAKCYMQLGSLLGEVDRMIKRQEKK